MTRYSFLSSFMGLFSPSIPKPKNGECPCCHTIAKPFKPTLDEYYPIRKLPGNGSMEFRGCAPQPVNADGTAYSVCISPSDKDLPTERVVTCAFCSNMFVQKAVQKVERR